MAMSQPLFCLSKSSSYRCSDSHNLQPSFQQPQPDPYPIPIYPIPIPSLSIPSLSHPYLSHPYPIPIPNPNPHPSSCPKMVACLFSTDCIRSAREYTRMRNEFGVHGEVIAKMLCYFDRSPLSSQFHVPGSTSPCPSCPLCTGPSDENRM